MRWLTIAVAVVGLSLVAVGCGGDDETSGDTTVVTETTVIDETTTEDDGEPSEGLASSECLALGAATSSLGQAFAAPGTEVDSEGFEALADRVPDEISDDYQVLADAYSAYEDAVGDVDLEAGEVPDAETLQALQQALVSIDQQELAQATQNISAWVTENCRQ